MFEGLLFLGPLGENLTQVCLSRVLEDDWNALGHTLGLGLLLIWKSCERHVCKVMVAPGIEDVYSVQLGCFNPGAFGNASKLGL